jgi:copper chaperone
MQQFKTEGMTCQGCVRAVTRAVHDVDPQARVLVDLTAQQIDVESEQPPERLQAAIEEAGYPVLSARRTG